MKSTTFLAAAILLAASNSFSAASQAGSALREKYFSADWAQAKDDVPPAPAPTEPPSEPQPDPDKPVNAEHSTVAHMYITRVGYEMYAAQYEGGELAEFIGDASGKEPASGKHDTVVAGAYEEDKPYLNPFNELMSFNRHFWNYTKGDYAGWLGFDSSVNRAHKYWSGGFGIDGKYDKDWSENKGSLRGTKGEGVLGLYAKGDKAKAYWYLGHVAHLLEDLTVPAHNHLYAHPFHGSDAYESYIGDHYTEWLKVPEGDVESFDSLYALFHATGEVTHHYDAGSGPGPLGVDGDQDQGRRRKAHFTEELLKDEGNVLMPLAYKRVAALFVYFFKQIDHTAPNVRLTSPSSSDSKNPDQASVQRIILKASASDSQSGVDKDSYRFEYRRWTGVSWTAWRRVMVPGPHAEFAAPADGGLFAFRALASDAAGNVGRSPEKYVRFQLPVLAGLPIR
jgi:hypothetical protein